MGYKRPEKVYKLIFDKHDGLEVRVASVPTGVLLELSELAEQLKEGSAKSFGEARRLFDTFADRLRSWNLEEDDGTPIPTTIDAVLSLEFGFVVEIVTAWFDVLSEVSDPLDRRSSGGSSSEVPPMQMETL